MDDIACRLSDGSAMYVSAKRACGDDRALKATVALVSTVRGGAAVVLRSKSPPMIRQEI